MTETRGQQQPWTVGRLLQWTTEWFKQKDVEGERLAAELLLARAMECSKIELYTRYEQVPTEQQRAAFRELVRQAGEHTPIAYLLGYREFYSLNFEVTPAVLIPRPETEVLVQRIVELTRTEPDRQWNVLEIGTGSGCIAAAIAKFAKNASVTATDASPEALEVATANVERHGVADRVELVQADGLDLPDGTVPPGGFDILVSNPPYISDEHWPKLPPDVRDHEPKQALVTPSGDGLDMYRLFAEQAPQVLCPGGTLLVEIGYDQKDDVIDIFNRIGAWNFQGVRRDSTDPHDRALEFTAGRR
jgi:release factor glutamine methyltransferase